MSAKPQLGHYWVQAKDDRVVKVVPANPDVEAGRTIQLWIMQERGPTLVAELDAGQARKVAQGLIIAAERLERPNAVAGPGAWEP